MRARLRRSIHQHHSASMVFTPPSVPQWSSHPLRFPRYRGTETLSGDRNAAPIVHSSLFTFHSSLFSLLSSLITSQPPTPEAEVSCGRFFSYTILSSKGLAAVAPSLPAVASLLPTREALLSARESLSFARASQPMTGEAEKISRDSLVPDESNPAEVYSSQYF